MESLVDVNFVGVVCIDSSFWLSSLMFCSIGVITAVGSPTDNNPSADDNSISGLSIDDDDTAGNTIDLDPDAIDDTDGIIGASVIPFGTLLNLGASGGVKNSS